jgi:RNA polymerase subunit RPABC4/transcription elongation factor Spt4
MLDWESLGNLVLVIVAALGAFGSALWLSMVLWTFRDMRARARDPLAQILAAAVVAILNVPGLIVYLILRPRETLTEAYERSLEGEALLQSIEEKPICPGCGRAVREHWQVCPYCHTKLKKVCITCGELLELGWNICPHCASSQLGYAVAKPSAGRGQAPPRAAARLSTSAEETVYAEEAPQEKTAAYPEDAYPANNQEEISPGASYTAPRRERRVRRRAPIRTDAVQFIEDDDF